MFKKAPPQNNSHEYVEARLSDYIDGQLSEDDRARVRKHLQTCKRCQENLETLGWTVKLLRQAPAPRLPRQFTLPAPETGRAGGTAPAWLKWSLSAASVVAALAFVILLSVDLISRGAVSPAAYAPAAAPAVQTRVGLAVPKSPETDRSVPATAAPPQPTTAPVGIQTGPEQATPEIIPPTEMAPTAIAAVPPLASIPAPTHVAPLLQSKPTPTLGCQACGGGGELATPTPSFPCTVPCGLGGGGGAEGPGQTTQPATSPSFAVPTFVTEGLVNAPQLSVRAEPSADSEELGTLDRGSILTVFGRDVSGDWLQVLFPPDNSDDERGWTSGEFVLLPIAGNTLPVVAATPTPSPTPAGQFSSRTVKGTGTPLSHRLAPAPPSPTRTRAPTRTATATVTVTVTGTASPTATHTPSPTRAPTETVRPTRTPNPPAAVSTAPPARQPEFSARGEESSSLRLGEIAALVAAMVLGLSALIIARHG